MTRPDLGDVSKGELVTLDNFERLFKDILNQKQLEGLRLLVTPFPQQQFNATEDRRSLKAHQGVACFDCHANGHTNAATHTVGDIRPNEHRHRIDTPSLRGVGIQRLFGSQRALKSVEDFTEFEQRAAYFDGDMTRATRKGVSPLERGSQVHPMGEFQNLLDFPPAPKLNILGRLDPAKSSEAERRGEALFFGKAQCAACHVPPYYTDNLMHNLRTERFFKEVTINGRKASADGPIKTFPLRGIKDSPPYLHDDRLLTLDDTVEFFNLVLGLKLAVAGEDRTSSRSCGRCSAQRSCFKPSTTSGFPGDAFQGSGTRRSGRARTTRTHRDWRRLRTHWHLGTFFRNLAQIVVRSGLPPDRGTLSPGLAIAHGWSRTSAKSARGVAGGGPVREGRSSDRDAELQPPRESEAHPRWFAADIVRIKVRTS